MNALTANDLYAVTTTDFDSEHTAHTIHRAGVALGVVLETIATGEMRGATYSPGPSTMLTGDSLDAVAQQILADWNVVGERKLELSTGSFDQDHSFTLEVPGYKGKHAIRVKLYCGYKSKDDGQYWAMNTGGTVKAHYTAADRRERNRLNVMAPIKHGDIVQIAGEAYRVEVLGNYSNAALFHKVGA